MLTGLAAKAVFLTTAIVALTGGWDLTASKTSDNMVRLAQEGDGGSVADAAAPAWTIAPGGSLEFVAVNDGLPLNGWFSSWSGDIAMDPAAPDTAQIEITIDLSSASLGDTARDQTLKGADFLNAAGMATAVWNSTAVSSTGENSYKAEGVLTLKGFSQPQEITFTLDGEGNERSVSGEAEIDRNAFSVGSGPSASGVDPLVSLSFNFDATS